MLSKQNDERKHIDDLIRNGVEEGLLVRLFGFSLLFLNLG